MELLNVEGKTKNRVMYFDVLTTVSMIAVVILHTGGSVWKTNQIGTLAWDIALLWQVLFIWCVPILLMLSGIKMLDYRTRYTTRELLKKRMFKVLIPFIIWSIITYVLTNPISLDFIYVKNFFNLFFKGEINPIYWYFYVLIGLYLLLPVLSLMIENSSKELLQYLLLTNFIFQIGIPFIYNIFGMDETQFEVWTTYMKIAPYAGYFILGYYLVKYPIRLRNLHILSFISILSIPIVYLILWYTSMQDKDISKFIYSYNSPYCWFLSIVIFSWIRKLFENKIIPNFIKSITIQISSMSLGIYIIHQFVKQGFLKIIPSSETNILFILVGWIPVFIITILLVFIIRKIPILNKILP